MAVQADLVYKDRDAITSELAASLQARIPDINLGEDSVIRIWIETMATTVEGLYLAAQLLHDDMFPQTASALALRRMGEFWGRPIKGGSFAAGTLLFSGVGGTVIPIGTLAASPSASDDALRFATTALGTIPNPGVPSAPTAADGGAGALPVGTFEYAVSFTTAAGETPIGAASNALVLAAGRQVNLTAIPIGGPGTLTRKIYRRKNGGAWAFVLATAANIVTTATDNVADGALGGPPLDVGTATSIAVAAQGEDVGNEYNVGVGTVTALSDSPTGVTGVTNTTAFTGGGDEEDIEDFRAALLDFIRAPKSGAPSDLEVWAEAITGVESATAFPNDNLGVPTSGHATVRIVGPAGAVPSGAVVAAVLADLQSRDVANVTLHVGTFVTHAVDVTVTITLQANYLLADVTDSIVAAITNYILSVPIGGIVHRAGIVSAVFGLPGVETLVVNIPAADVTMASTEKSVAGTVTVS
jgi:uncharacterized phage protein gp47/JayE